MSKYAISRSKNSALAKLVRIAAVLIFSLVLIALAGRLLYTRNLGPVSDDQRTQIITIESGSSVKQIATQLEAEHLIRSAWALQIYAHGKGASGKFQAGSYALAPSASTPQIVTALTKGQVSRSLVTILPGRRIDQVRADLINDGYSPQAVDQALQPGQYANSPTMALLIPVKVTTLEGLLWPDSYQKDPETPLTQIIRQALDATAQHITGDVQSGFAAEQLTLYQGIVLASIIEQEVSKPADRAQAAQVFLSRLKINMMLGSDVTANYGAIAAGRSPNLRYDSPYNTLLHTGLPPTPISSISNGSLQATAHPAATNWLYFVAGDDGITYFSKTLAEHEALSSQHCHKLCGR